MNYSNLFISVASSTSGGNERRRSSRTGIFSSPANSVHGREPGSVNFTMEEIYAATRNFSPTFKIGQGGFGTVYKGRLQDGTVVAIKRAKKVGESCSLFFCFSECEYSEVSQIAWLSVSAECV
jgi:hypothetical protein